MCIRADNFLQNSQTQYKLNTKLAVKIEWSKLFN